MVAGAETEGTCRVFRPPRDYRDGGVLSLIFFTGISLAWGTLMSMAAPPEREVYVILFTVSLWSVPASLSCWMLLKYRIVSLTIEPSIITVHGIFSRKVLDLTDVQKVSWRLFPMGLRVFMTHCETVSLTVSHFSPEDQIWLIRHFRQIFPEAIQENWPLYCLHAASRLRKKKHTVVPPPGPDEVLLTRKHWDRLLLPCILLTAVAGVVAAWKFGLPRLLTAPVLPTALWLYLRFLTPRQGMVARKLSADPEQNSQLAFYGWFLLVSLLLLYVSRFVNFPWLDETTFSICVSLIAICIVFWKSYQFGKAIEQKHREASKASVKEWDATQSDEDQLI